MCNLTERPGESLALRVLGDETDQLYDDSSLLGWTGAGAGIGAMLSAEDRGTGALLGGLAGVIVESIGRAPAPSGIAVTCLKCSYSYSVHLTDDMGQFSCNNRMELISPPAKRSPPVSPME